MDATPRGAIGEPLRRTGRANRARSIPHAHVTVISFGAMVITFTLLGRWPRERLEMVPAVETTVPRAPFGTRCTASWWSWPQRMRSIPSAARPDAERAGCARPCRCERSPLTRLWCITTTRAFAARRGVECRARAIDLRLAQLAHHSDIARIPRERMRLHAMCRVQPTNVAPGTCSTGSRSSAMNSR